MNFEAGWCTPLSQPWGHRSAQKQMDLSSSPACSTDELPQIRQNHSPRPFYFFPRIGTHGQHLLGCTAEPHPQAPLTYLIVTTQLLLDTPILKLRL